MKEESSRQLVAQVAAPGKSLPSSAQAIPASAAGIGRRFSSAVLFVWRRRWRVLGVTFLLTLVGLIAGGAALLCWTDYHLRQARRAVEQGHNAVAARHLQACRRFRPDHPEALLLSAAVARRSGAWEQAEALLDRYWKLRGDDDALVCERLLLRATRGEVEEVQPLLEARIEREETSAPTAREALVAGLLYRYRLSEAGEQINRWLQHDPRSPGAWLLHGKW